MSTWTQQQIDTLRAAVASGILEVTFEGPPRRTVRYQTLGEMRDQLASMEASASRAAGRPSVRLVATRKGF